MKKTDWREGNFYSVEDETKKCAICGVNKNLGLEPRFGYIVCENHKDVPPVKINLPKNKE
jgi:hypothetical protein